MTAADLPYGPPERKAFANRGLPPRDYDDSRPGMGQLIRAAAADRQVQAVIEAINITTTTRRANRAAVMVARAQVLAPDVNGEPSAASEIRAGIMALIDGSAMQCAPSRNTENLPLRSA